MDSRSIGAIAKKLTEDTTDLLGMIESSEDLQDEAELYEDTTYKSQVATLARRAQYSLETLCDLTNEGEAMTRHAWEQVSRLSP